MDHSEYKHLAKEFIAELGNARSSLINSLREVIASILTSAGHSVNRKIVSVAGADRSQDKAWDKMLLRLLRFLEDKTSKIFAPILFPNGEKKMCCIFLNNIILDYLLRDSSETVLSCGTEASGTIIGTEAVEYSDETDDADAVDLRRSHIAAFEGAMLSLLGATASSSISLAASMKDGHGKPGAGPDPRNLARLVTLCRRGRSARSGNGIEIILEAGPETSSAGHPDPVPVVELGDAHPFASVFRGYSFMKGRKKARNESKRTATTVNTAIAPITPGRLTEERCGREVEGRALIGKFEEMDMDRRRVEEAEVVGILEDELGERDTGVDEEEVGVWEDTLNWH
ncbi:hypothetical protein B0H19DRAFT_1084450 [Mycena capillaripes]|nr:hypothetical protein B0H19DRAFT_1084450 [Mycena capillaripes]